MVTLPKTLVPSQGRYYLRRFVTPTAKQAVDLDTLLNRLEEVIRLLPSLRTPKQLASALEQGSQEFLHLKNEIGKILTSELSARKFLALVFKSQSEVKNMIRHDTAILTGRQKKQLLSLMDSNMAMVRAFMEAFQKEKSEATDLLLECSPFVNKSDMCISAIALVLAGGIKEWHPLGIKWLCKVAEENMVAVEDIFLMHDPRWLEGLEYQSGNVTLQEVKQEIGIHR